MENMGVMYQSSDRKTEQSSKKQGAKSRMAQAQLNQTPHMKKAAQLQGMADHFVEAKEVVQRRRVTVVYKGGTVIGHNTGKLTLGQLEDLLQHPDLTQKNRLDIQAAIEKGEYLDGVEDVEEAMSISEDAPPSKQSNVPLMDAPKGMEAASPTPSPFAPPQPNLMGFPQPIMGPPQPQQKGLPQFLAPAPKVNPQQGSMAPPPSRPFATPALPMGKGATGFGSGFKLPQARVVQDEVLTLYRGLHSAEQGERILQNNSAGGDPANPKCGRPAEQSVVAQVGMDDVHPNAPASTPFKDSDVCEYSTSLEVAQAAAKGKNGGVITVRISTKYLKKGDNGRMKGWTALRCAPLDKFVAWDKPPKRDDDPDALGT